MIIALKKSLFPNNLGSTYHCLICGFSSQFTIPVPEQITLLEKTNSNCLFFSPAQSSPSDESTYSFFQLLKIAVFL